MTNDTNTMVADPLDTPIGDIELGFPVFPAGPRKCTIKGSKVERSKKDTGDNLVMQLTTDETYVSEKGTDVPAGHPLTYRIFVTPTERLTAASINKSVGRLLKALGFANWQSISVKQLKNDPAMLDGKSAVFSVAVRQESAEFPRSNEVKGVILEG